jgi:hypothetical protein
MSLGCRAWYPITTTNVINNMCSHVWMNVPNAFPIAPDAPWEQLVSQKLWNVFPRLGKFNFPMFGNMHSCHVRWSQVGTHPKPNMGTCGHTSHVGTCIHVQMCNMGFHVGTCHPMWEFLCSLAWKHSFHVGKCVPMCSQLSHRCHVGTMYIPRMHGCNKCAP